MRRYLVLVSLTGHAVLVFVFFVAGLWHIDRLEAAKRPFDLAVAPEPSLPPPAPSGGGALPKPKLRHKLPPPREITLPPVARPTEVPDPIHAEVPGTGGGSGSDVGPGTGPGKPTDPGTCTTPPCGESKQEPKDDVVTTIRIPPPTIRSLRISGETQIQPPEAVKTAMVHEDRRRTSASFEVCLSATGDVVSIRLVGSSGYDRYDAALAAAIRTWRYRPFQVGGRAIPVCGIVTFVYAME